MISPVKIWRNQKRIRSMLGVVGHIVSWTQIYVPPTGFVDHAPYVVVIAQLSDGRRYTAQLVDFEKTDLVFGAKVQTVLRRTRDPGTEGVIPYGVKFKPL